jgi:hypothetical protein
MRLVVLLLVASCGRLGFEDRTAGDAGDASGTVDGSMPLGPFEPATLITQFVSGFPNDDPAISPDGLELYVATTMGGASEDLYVSTRATRSSSWSTLSLVDEVSSPSIAEKAPKLTADGLALYYVSGNDIWVARRTAVGQPWSTGMLVLDVTGVQLGTPAVCDDERQMFVRIGGDGAQDISLSRRDSQAAAWPPPVLVPSLNSTSDEGGTWATRDCGRIYFDSDRDMVGVLYSADRIPGTDTFGPVTELAAFGGMLPAVHDVSLTTDERVMVFAHKSAGVDEIWETRR